MAFKVVVTEPAEQDIDEVTQYIAVASASAAAKWNAELWDVIFSLKEMPDRFSIIQEAEELGFPYRSVNYHSHRIIYQLDESAQTVFIMRVYHGARSPLSHDSLR